MTLFAAGSDQELPAAAERRSVTQAYPRGLLRAISLLTAVGVALQLFAGWQQTNALYPITGYSMFSSSTSDSALEIWYEGITDSGRSVVMRGEDLGLTDLQMRRSVSRHVMRAVAEGDEELAEARLGHVASVWDDGHDDELVHLSRWQRERWVDGRVGEPELVLTWSR